jgi:hypothetical protein
VDEFIFLLFPQFRVSFTPSVCRQPLSIVVVLNVSIEQGVVVSFGQVSFIRQFGRLGLGFPE